MYHKQKKQQQNKIHMTKRQEKNRHFKNKTTHFTSNTAKTNKNKRTNRLVPLSIRKNIHHYLQKNPQKHFINNIKDKTEKKQNTQSIATVQTTFLSTSSGVDLTAKNK